MGKVDNNILNNFLNNFPRNEIINKLSDIDTKISSLHTISSKDFLYFNKLLKQYYKNIKEISDANSVISVFINNDLPVIKSDINDKNAMQVKLISETDSNINNVIDLLTQIYSSIDLLVVPFNNFKQNLITLKYILANLKLHLNYVELSNKNELQKSVESIESSIEKIYNQIEKIDTNTESVSKQITYLKNNTCLIENLSSSKLNNEIRKAINIFKKISSDSYLPESFVSDLNSRTQKCFAYMGEVITNIQYHDIIRQKMEHIQTSQNKLINEIKSINKSEQNTDDQLQLIVKIPEITDIQVAQLLYTNKDYQTSIEKITNQLIEVGNEMKALHSIYSSIHENAYKFDSNTINQIVAAQGVFSGYFEKLTENRKKATVKISQLKSDYNNLKNEYNTIFLNEKALRKEVHNFESLMRANGKNFGKELTRRIKDLFSDLQVNSNSLKTHLNSITQNIKFLTNIFDTFKPRSENYYIDKKSIDNLSDKTGQIKQKTKEYALLSTKISDEITLSLKKIEYYTYFKITVEEIVSLLNEINKIVNYDSLKSNLGDNKKYLKEIEKLYTMKSERDIHAKLTDTGKSVDELLNESDSIPYNIDDNDIELF